MSRRNSRHRAPTRTPSRSAARSAPPPRRRMGVWRRRSPRSRSSGRKGAETVVDKDEHPRETTLEALAKLPTPFREGGTVTAGNASGVNDGAAALLLASAAACAAHGLTPVARVLGGATAGVPPRIMGIGPAPATRKLLARLGMTIGDFDVIELNEAFATQALAVTARSSAFPTTRRRQSERRRDRHRPSARRVGRAHCRNARRWNSARRAAASALPPCASASARASRSPSSAPRRLHTGAGAGPGAGATLMPSLTRRPIAFDYRTFVRMSVNW